MRVAALALCATAALASTTTSVQFGMYDADLLPDGGWQLMSETDFATHRVQFIEAYNANAGIDVIAPFKTGNCCIAVAGGKKLTVEGSKFGVAFPAATTGGVRCNPEGGIIIVGSWPNTSRRSQTISHVIVEWSRSATRRS